MRTKKDGWRTSIMILVAAASVGLLLSACGGGVDDPADASCQAPPVGSGEMLTFADHRQVDLRFTCMGAVQAGGRRPVPGGGVGPRLRGAHPAHVGFAGLADIERMTVPGLWLYGTADTQGPPDQCIAILDRLKARGKDITVVTFAGAGHGLLDTPPTDPDALPTMVRWIGEHVHANLPE